jgi:hypothetical protein
MRPTRTRPASRAARRHGLGVLGGFVVLVALIVGVVALVERFAPGGGSTAATRALAVADDSCEASLGRVGVAIVLVAPPTFAPPVLRRSAAVWFETAAPAPPARDRVVDRGPPPVSVA